jgi:hypothetical protein
VTFSAPTIDPATLAAWCDLHLGSPVARELFRGGHLTRVIGVRLADGREVVVGVRPSARRVVGCIEVQRRLYESGYPCPQPLAGPAPFGEYQATAESYVSGGVMRDLIDSFREVLEWGLFAAACRHHGRDATRTLTIIGLIPARLNPAPRHYAGAPERCGARNLQRAPPLRLTSAAVYGELELL